MAEIKVPQVGESVTEGVLSRWLKKDGASVRAGDPLFELETDKATQDVTAPADGILQITVAEGTAVSVGSVVGHVTAGGVPATPKSDTPKPAAAKVSEPVLMPAARQMAADAGVDIGQLSGSGREGRILKEDVANYIERQKPAPPPSTPVAYAPGSPETPGSPEGRETRQRMSAIRQRIAARLIEAQTSAAILTTFNEIDMAQVMSLRTKYKEPFQKKHGVGLGFMSFFVKACVEGLKAFPAVNARIEGSDIVYQHFYDFGVAVSTERGLMVPVVRGCDTKSFADIEREITALAQKAREGKISAADLQGGTFTITNGGIFGSLLSTPILNPPQSGILGMHTIQKRPVAINDEVVIRPMMYTALSYDHRLIDGREAVSFLVRIKECIENPERLLLEI